MTDLMMPEMDCFELVAALEAKAAWRKIPAVVVNHAAVGRLGRPRLENG